MLGVETEPGIMPDIGAGIKLQPGPHPPDCLALDGGFVGLVDLNLILSRWNQTSPPAKRASVPEPRDAGLLLIGVEVLAVQSRW